MDLLGPCKTLDACNKYVLTMKDAFTKEVLIDIGDLARIGIDPRFAGTELGEPGAIGFTARRAGGMMQSTIPKGWCPRRSMHGDAALHD